MELLVRQGRDAGWPSAGRWRAPRPAEKAQGPAGAPRVGRAVLEERVLARPGTGEPEDIDSIHVRRGSARQTTPVGASRFHVAASRALDWYWSDSDVRPLPSGAPGG